MKYEEYKNLKEEYLDYIIFIKSGNFFHVYDDDGIIINYLFKYKIKDNMVGFPISSLDKVVKRLDRDQVNYYIDRDKKKSFIDNNYTNLLDKASLYLELSKDVEDIYNYLMSNIERKYIKRIIDKIKVVIDEG